MYHEGMICVDPLILGSVLISVVQVSDKLNPLKTGHTTSPWRAAKMKMCSHGPSCPTRPTFPVWTNIKSLIRCACRSHFTVNKKHNLIGLYQSQLIQKTLQNLKISAPRLVGQALLLQFSIIPSCQVRHYIILTSYKVVLMFIKICSFSAPIDGQWGQWGDFGGCNSSCGINCCQVNHSLNITKLCNKTKL